MAGSHTTGQTAYTAQTGDTETTTHTVSTVTGTNVPLFFVSAFQDEQKRNKVETLQKVQKVETLGSEGLILRSVFFSSCPLLHCLILALLQWRRCE